MTRITRRAALALLFVQLAGWWMPAQAQVLGVFRWQMQPYCNLVTFTVIQQGPTYQLTGNDNLCGAPAFAPATGTATPNPDGTVSLGFDIVTSSAATAHVNAVVNLTTVSGTWTDADGNTGPFLFNPPGVGGLPRPAPTRSTLITSAQLAASIFAGSGGATTVARSDHTHDDRYFTKPETTAVVQAVVAEAGAAVVEQVFSVPADLTPQATFQSRTVTTPKAGRLLVNFAANIVTATCSPASEFHTYITVDGIPIRTSIVSTRSGDGVGMVSGILVDPVAAGSHDIRVVGRCSNTGSTFSVFTWFPQPRVSVVVLP